MDEVMPREDAGRRIVDAFLGGRRRAQYGNLPRFGPEMRDVVFDYLVRGGYAKTASAMLDDEKKASERHKDFKGTQNEQTIAQVLHHARDVQDAVLDGEPNTALHLLDTRLPHIKSSPAWSSLLRLPSLLGQEAQNRGFIHSIPSNRPPYSYDHLLCGESNPFADSDQSHGGTEDTQLYTLRIRLRLQLIVETMRGIPILSAPQPPVGNRQLDTQHAQDTTEIEPKTRSFTMALNVRISIKQAGLIRESLSNLIVSINTLPSSRDRTSYLREVDILLRVLDLSWSAEEELGRLLGVLDRCTPLNQTASSWGQRLESWLFAPSEQTDSTESSDPQTLHSLFCLRRRRELAEDVHAYILGAYGYPSPPSSARLTTGIDGSRQAVQPSTLPLLVQICQQTSALFNFLHRLCIALPPRHVWFEDGVTPPRRGEWEEWQQRESGKVQAEQERRLALFRHEEQQREHQSNFGWAGLAKRLLIGSTSREDQLGHENTRNTLSTREREAIAEILCSPKFNFDTLLGARLSRFQYEEDPVVDEAEPRTLGKSSRAKPWDDAPFDELYPGLQAEPVNNAGPRAVPFVLRMWLNSRDVDRPRGRIY